MRGVGSLRRTRPELYFDLCNDLRQRSQILTQQVESRTIIPGSIGEARPAEGTGARGDARRRHVHAQQPVCAGWPAIAARAAIIARAAGIILVHNHASGDPTPSAEDRAVTRQLVAAGQLLDIPVYDHVIVGRGRCTSFAETGLL